jgi:glycosyltransferase involved in cell wall biosynthesis
MPFSQAKDREEFSGNSQPLVSVVTPFYNTADYLAECLESVLTQTYGEFEYLLLNNCSTDGSLEIAERYARSDPRVRLATNPSFLTQVQNYNAALDLISPTSRYTKIVQADDKVFPRCLEEMVAVAESDSSVGIVSSFGLRGRRVILDDFPFPGNVVSGRELCRYQLLKGPRFFASPTTVMYRSDIVRQRNPFYGEHRYFEDTENCFDVLESWNFGFVRQVLSFLRDDNESVMSRIRILDPFWYMLEHIMILRQFGPRFLSAEEFEPRWSEIERRYLDHLAPYLCFVRDRNFWDYHLRGLESVGYKLSQGKKLGAAARYLGTLMTRPRESSRVVATFVLGLGRRGHHTFGQDNRLRTLPDLAPRRLTSFS